MTCLTLPDCRTGDEEDMSPGRGHARVLLHGIAWCIFSILLSLCLFNFPLSLRLLDLIFCFVFRWGNDFVMGTKEAKPREKQGKSEVIYREYIEAG